MTSLQPVEPVEKLQHLGAEIDALRQDLRQTVVKQAATIGRRLSQAKRLCRHGQWLPWLAERQISERSAQQYMQIADKMHELMSLRNPKRVSDFVAMTFREALRATQLEDQQRQQPGGVDLRALQNQKRANDIGKGIRTLDRLAANYGTEAVLSVVRAHEQPDPMRDIEKNCGNIIASITQRKPTLVIDAEPVVEAPAAPPPETFAAIDADKEVARDLWERFGADRCAQISQYWHSWQALDAPATKEAAPPATKRVAADADLRTRLQALIDKNITDDARFARHAGLAETVITKLLSGRTIGYSDRRQVQAALDELAGY